MSMEHEVRKNAEDLGDRWLANENLTRPLEELNDDQLVEEVMALRRRYRETLVDYYYERDCRLQENKEGWDRWHAMKDNFHAALFVGGIIIVLLLIYW